MLVSWADGDRDPTFERIDDPTITHSPQAVRVAPGAWLMIARRGGVAGIARVERAGTELRELPGLILDYGIAWAGAGRAVLAWERPGHEYGFSSVDASTLRIEPIALPVPVRYSPYRHMMFGARSALLVVPGVEDDAAHPLIAIVTADAVSLLELTEADPQAAVWLFGRPGTNTAAVAWDEDDRSAIRLAPLRCD